MDQPQPLFCFFVVFVTIFTEKLQSSAGFELRSSNIRRTCRPLDHHCGPIICLIWLKKIHYWFQEVQHEQRPVSQVPLVDQYSSQQLSGQKDKFAKLPWVVEPSVCRKCTKFARIIAKRFGIQPRSIRHRPANVVRNDWLRDQQRRKFWRANQPARGCGHDHEESLRYAAKKVI